MASPTSTTLKGILKRTSLDPELSGRRGEEPLMPASTQSAVSNEKSWDSGLGQESWEHDPIWLAVEEDREQQGYIESVMNVY